MVEKYDINKTSKKIILTTKKKNKYTNKLNRNIFSNNPVTKQITVRTNNKNYKVLANAYLEKIIINKNELLEAENKDIKLVFKTSSEETTEITLADNTTDLIEEINKNINPRYWYLDYTGEILNVLIADFINTVLLDLQEDMETLSEIVENIVTDLPFIPSKSYTSWIEDVTVDDDVIVAGIGTGQLFTTDLYFLDENNNQVVIDETNNDLLFSDGSFIYDVEAKLNNIPVDVTFEQYCNSMGGVNYFRPSITIIEDTETETAIPVEEDNILILEFINTNTEQSFTTEYHYNIVEYDDKTFLQPVLYPGGQETTIINNIIQEEDDNTSHTITTSLGVLTFKLLHSDTRYLSSIFTITDENGENFLLDDSMHTITIGNETPHTFFLSENYTGDLETEEYLQIFNSINQNYYTGQAGQGDAQKTFGASETENYAICSLPRGDYDLYNSGIHVVYGNNGQTESFDLYAGLPIPTNDDNS